MRMTIVGALAVGVLVAGCGSSGATSAPVESSSASGQVASSIPNCQEGAPARGEFRTGTHHYDGVLGAIYNDTSGALEVKQWKEACRLEPGRSVAFAVGTPAGESNGGLIRPRNPEDFTITSASGGVAVEVEVDDPNMGWPIATVKAASCQKAESPGLSEGQSWQENSQGNGEIRITRLEDDADIAREWSGTDSWSVDDWARIDVRVVRMGTGC